MKPNSFFSSWFHLSRKERTGVLVIILIICALFFLTPVYQSLQPALHTADTSWMSVIDYSKTETPTYPPRTYSNQSTGLRTPYSQYSSNKSRSQPFYFDPNTVDEEGWQKLGLRPKTIATILNFRSKGGKFLKAEDLQKIYGLFPDEFARLAPYIRIESAAEARKDLPILPVRKTATYGPVDINSADTAAFMALPGIGSKLANRIVVFREKLGGFYEIDQVAETYGLADSVFQKLRAYFVLGSSEVRKININTATLDELKAHPYIRFALASPIIAYRNAHGNFTTTGDIKKIMAVSAEQYSRMAPYLTIE